MRWDLCPICSSVSVEDGHNRRDVQFAHAAGPADFVLTLHMPFTGME